MAKTTGLGHRLLVGGVDISGDVTALDEITGSKELLECTGIDKSAKETIGGVRDGLVTATSWFNPAVGAAHETLSALPTSDVHLMYLAGAAVGDPAACMVAQQANYAPTREDDGSLTVETEHKANAYGLEWCELLTAGLQTRTTTGDNAHIDNAAATTFGAQAYLQVLDLQGGGGDVSIEVHHSTDNFVANEATLMDFGFPIVVGAYRDSAAGTVRRYLRVRVLGTFTSVTFALALTRNATEVVF